MLSPLRWRDECLARPTRAVIQASIALRAATSLLLLVVGSLLPSFETDAAPLSQPVSWWARPFVRWDTVHFVNIALEGYTAEQRTAFMPGLPGLMRAGGEALHWLRRAGAVTGDEVVLAGLLATTIATTAAALCFHRLTLQLFPSRPSFALLTSLLFLAAPARPTLHGIPYTEPFAALCTFGGLLLFFRGRDVPAALVWGAGTAFRAQGAVLGVGFFGWKWVLRRSFDRQTSRIAVLKRLLLNLPRFAFLSLLSGSPFLLFQAYVYREYCPSPAGDLRPWCTEGHGMSYGWVQREYWDVGLFRYWKLLQLPNFVLAAPVLALSLVASYSFYARSPRAVIALTLPFLPLSPVPSAPAPDRPLTAPPPAALSALTPIMHLHTATTLLLLLSAHVQIALRLCATQPVMWWYAAELLAAPPSSRRAWWGRAWERYVGVWGWIAVALWAVALPPA
ncbi:ER membrane glycoprotein subunit of the GPI transamidase complex-like protein [Rhodotorula kratochvilovae]